MKGFCVFAVVFVVAVSADSHRRRGNRDSDESFEVSDYPPIFLEQGLIDEAYQGNMESVNYLLDVANVTADARSVDGTTALMAASFAGQLEAVKALLNKGANIAVRDYLMHQPIHAAVLGNSTIVIEYLLSQGADINAQNIAGSTPLAIAAFIGHEATAQKLIDLGAEVNKRDYGWSTPRKVAEESGYDDVADMIGRNGGIL